MTLQVPEAEQAVIGAAMLDASACSEAFERLKPDHFAIPEHGVLWDALCQLHRADKATDPVGLHGKISGYAPYEGMGGIAYLADLVDHANTYSVADHVDLILDRAARRSIKALAQNVAAQADLTIEGTAETVLADLERGAAEIARDGVTRSHALPVGMTALENLEAAWRGDFVGTPTGLQCLDHVTAGIRQDDVWFIGGRTSMGKSVVALSLGRGIAEQGRGVMMFSLEMPMREVQARLVADIAHDGRQNEQVRYGDLLKGRGTLDIRDRAKTAARRLASLPMSVTDAGGLTIDDIRSQAQRQIRAWEKGGVKPGAILIDHIGLVKPIRRSDSKAAETADIVNELKGLAKQLRCPVIALAQVNRQTENRNDKRPTLADLNWSGAIEQIADFICLLYREAYYLERSAEHDADIRAAAVEHEIELLIHKNRAGPICNIKAWIDVSCNALRDPDAIRQQWRSA